MNEGEDEAMTETYPDKIFLTPEDAEMLGRKYGHPDLELVCVGDDYVAYVREDRAATDETMTDTTKSIGTYAHIDTTASGPPDDQPKLLPCPFCGGDNIYPESEEICCPIEYFGQAKCIDCDAVGPLAEFKYDNKEDALEGAAAAWNTRAAPKVKPLKWGNKNAAHGYPDTAVDCFGGVWERWFVDGREYFKAPNSGRYGGQQGSADEDHERRILSALA